MATQTAASSLPDFAGSVHEHGSAILQHVADTATWMSIAAFAVFAIALLKSLFAPTLTAKDIAAHVSNIVSNTRAANLAPSADDLAKIIQAVAGFVSSLSQATPAAASLIASVLFLSIAVLCGEPYASTNTSHDTSTTHNSQGRTVDTNSSKKPPKDNTTSANGQK